MRREFRHVNVEHEQRDDDGEHPVGQRQNARRIPAPLVTTRTAARSDLVIFPHEASLTVRVGDFGFFEPAGRSPGAVRRGVPGLGQARAADANWASQTILVEP